MQEPHELNRKRENLLQQKKLFRILLVTGIILMASNLRAPLTSVGPVLQEISYSLSLSNVSASLLTTIPLLCFAGLSSFIPRWSNDIGMERFLVGSILILILGLSFRPIGSVSFLMLGVTFIGIAITIGNVLMPAFIKKHFSNNAGILTGVYSVSMNLSAALAAGLSIPIGNITQLGWRGSIGIWVILAIITLLVWLPINFRVKTQVRIINRYNTSTIWRSKLAWSIAMFMGFQSFIYYAMITWWPEMLVSWGVSAKRAGWAVSYVQLAQLPITFITPIIAGRMKRQQSLIIVITAMMLLAFGLLYFFQASYLILSCITLGIGTGAAFSLAMMLFVIKSNAPEEAAALSGMAQSIGYLIAAFGPPIFGYLFDCFQDWNSSLLSLILVVFLILLTGLYATQSKKI